MKHLLLACFTLVSLCAAAQAKKVADVAKFSSMTVDLGKVKVGSPVTGTFTVTNVGTTPLIIENVQPSCGCTKSDYTKEPIAPGKGGTITATYNAAVVGNFNKTVYVKFAGVNEQVGLNIVGQVLTDATPTTTPVKTGSK
jgi:opacity protein-like surface antigen